MMNKKQLESLLKINGVPPTAPKEVIRSVLISARYTDNEIDTAITILSQETEINPADPNANGLHKIFRSDQSLKSEEISELLGIDITVGNIEGKNIKNRNLSTREVVIICVTSVLLALIGIIFYMYIYDAGFFHQSASAGGLFSSSEVSV